MVEILNFYNRPPKSKYLVRIQKGSNPKSALWSWHGGSSSVTRHIKARGQWSSREKDSENRYEVIVYLIEFVLDKCIERPIADPVVIYSGAAEEFPGFKKGKVKGT